MPDESYVILALFSGRATYIFFIYRRNHHKYHLMRGMKLLEVASFYTILSTFLILTTLFNILPVNREN